MRVRTLRVPQFLAIPGLTRFLEEFLQAINRTTDTKMDKDMANHSLLLQSPDLSVWEITVSDLGVLTATKVAG